MRRTYSVNIAVLSQPQNAPSVHGEWQPDYVTDTDEMVLTDADGCSLILDQADVAALANHLVATLTAREEHTDDPHTHDPRCSRVSRRHAGGCDIP